MALAFARSCRLVKLRQPLRPKLSRSALVTSMDIHEHARMIKEAFATGIPAYPPSPYAEMLLERLESGQWPKHEGPGLYWDGLDGPGPEVELQAELTALDQEVADLKAQLALIAPPSSMPCARKEPSLSRPALSPDGAPDESLSEDDEDPWVTFGQDVEDNVFESDECFELRYTIAERKEELIALRAKLKQYQEATTDSGSQAPAAREKTAPKASTFP